ncbi:MAG: T9SS type A sorting domain-containing protein [Calditrichaeota bacterium]|nr:T9SS type A sorting domain-containing protein [Calditrichota bacterium]MCB9367844.1 T9SS type A sorting domain-containing protein [Calditrichota bacterium]
MVKRSLFSVLLCVAACVQFSNAQITAFISYCDVPNELGCGCDAGSRVSFEQGTTSWCVFWDRTADGIDASDELVPIGTAPGQADWSCQSFNGEDYCGRAGNFASDPPFVLANSPIEPDQPVYYIKISGPSCCWVSDTFRLQNGLQDIVLGDGDFSCTGEPCPVGVAPDQVTNLTVSDEQYCTEVRLTWQHSGENVTGFAIYVYNDDTEEWDFNTQVTSGVRAATIPVCANGDVQIGIETVNGSQTSEMTTGVGRTFLRRFDRDNPYTVSGNDITMNLIAPPQGEACRAFVYFDLYCGGAFLQHLCQFTNPDSLRLLHVTCTLPQSTPDPDCYIVMRDSSAASILGGCVLTDTLFDITVDADDAPVVPREFALEQNYPNPFNPSTTIEYTVPNEGVAELSVFNVAGQKVATLVNGNVSAGQHNIQWNAANISTGVYFYQLKMGDQFITRKMLLMK